MTAPNPPFATEIRPYGKAAIAQAARLIEAGGAVAVPTETVYGLAADATNPDAVAWIYEAKGRPGFNPLIVHVRDLAQAEEIGLFNQAARSAAAAYWPGPLTIVVPLREEHKVAPGVTAGLPTIALRAPDHSAMRDLLEATGKPLAAPSANASGGVSPTRAEHVLTSLGGRIPLVLDAGPTRHGLESTIVAFAEDGLRLLRPGPIPLEDLQALARLSAAAPQETIEAPGQLASHYAPSKPLRLNACTAEADEWLIGFGKVAGNDNLSAAADLKEAATGLFDALHRAEAQNLPRIAVAPIPDTGIGLAINDRLRRAAAAKP